MPYIVAGLVAALVAGAEQYHRLGARFTLRNQAWVWWLLRVLLDGGLGALAVALLRSDLIDGPDNFLGWLVAGMAAPAVVRLRFLDIGRGDQARPVGIATAYEPLRGLIEGRLDKRSAECQSEWINYTLLPALERAQTSPGELADFLIDYLKASRLDKRKVDKEKEYIVRFATAATPTRSSVNGSPVTRSPSKRSVFSIVSGNWRRASASRCRDHPSAVLPLALPI